MHGAFPILLFPKKHTHIRATLSFLAHKTALSPAASTVEMGLEHALVNSQFSHYAYYYS